MIEKDKPTDRYFNYYFLSVISKYIYLFPLNSSDSITLGRYFDITSRGNVLFAEEKRNCFPPKAHAHQYYSVHFREKIKRKNSGKRGKGALFKTILGHIQISQIRQPLAHLRYL